MRSVVVECASYSANTRTRCRALTIRSGPELLSGAQNEYEAGVVNEHDCGLISPVLMFTVSATCSRCRSLVFKVPPGKGHPRPRRWLVDHPDGEGASGRPRVTMPTRPQAGTGRGNPRRNRSAA